MIIAGGVVRHTDGGVVGEAAVDFIRQFKVDFAVIGASAIDDDGALLDYDYREVRVAQAIISNARHVILVGDPTKFERSAPVRIAHISQVDTFVTDRCHLRSGSADLRRNAVELVETSPLPEDREPYKRAVKILFETLALSLYAPSSSQRKAKMLRCKRGGKVRAAPFDIAIIGGGINGCGIARDAAGRGLPSSLREGDLASGTSSASTKLIHGGLRYLEYYEFRLVREALMEREVLLRAAPHIIWPLRFVLPHHRGLRPAWLIRLGLFLYDHLGGRERLPATRRVDLTQDRGRRAAEAASSARGFEYSDCWVEDSRLVVLNAMDAAARGADVETRTAMLRAERRGGDWRVVRQRRDGRGARDHRARRSSTRPARGSPSLPRNGSACRSTRRCGWSKAATSSCRSCSTTIAPTSSRTPTAASSSPSPMSGISR